VLLLVGRSVRALRPSSSALGVVLVVRGPKTAFLSALIFFGEARSTFFLQPGSRCVRSPGEVPCRPGAPPINCTAENSASRITRSGRERHEPVCGSAPIVSPFGSVTVRRLLLTGPAASRFAPLRGASPEPAPLPSAGRPSSVFARRRCRHPNSRHSRETIVVALALRRVGEHGFPGRVQLPRSSPGRRRRSGPGRPRSRLAAVGAADCRPAPRASGATSSSS